jgi:hypothetical protein
MIKLPKSDLLKRQRLTSLLGLVLDGSRLDGLVLRRTDGALHIQQPFSVSLSLDPLTNDPELVGREIRNHLDAVGARERQCIVGVPLKWALTTHIEVPELPEADIAGFLQIEAERNFPCDVQTLHIVTSRSHTPSGKQHATLVGIPKSHLALLEQALRAAKLKPVSFSLGIAALQPPGADASNGVMALAIGESNVALQVTAGGGMAALRALEGALEAEGSQRVLHADLVAREARITLGQLPAELRETVRRIRVFGPRDLAQQLADELELRFESMGLDIECVAHYDANRFGVQTPPEAPVSAAFSLAGALLGGQSTPFEFLPPRVSPWRQVATRCASGKYRTAMTAAGSVAVLVGALFFYQQWQLWGLEAQWGKMSGKWTELKGLQDNVNQYGHWYDDRVKGLTILRALSQKFPEDGNVTAKTVEIRDFKTVLCTGTARNYPALFQTLARLRGLKEVRDVNLVSTRGQAPTM